MILPINRGIKAGAIRSVVLGILLTGAIAFAGGEKVISTTYYTLGKKLFPADPNLCTLQLHNGLQFALPPDTDPHEAEEFTSKHHARLAGDMLNMNRIGEDLAILTGELPIEGDRRIPDRESTEHREITRKFLTERLQKLGYDVKTEDFKAEVKTKKSKKAKKVNTYEFHGTNLFVEIAGSKKPDEIVEINAHYDTVKPDVPGADDNGTGVATLLEMARLFKGFQPERTIRFVLSDLEERGSLGAKFHAKAARKRNENIVGAVVVDMIGYFPGERGHFVMEIGTEKDFRLAPQAYQPNRDLANEIIFQYLSYNDRWTYISPVTVGSLPTTGDHGAYWANGYPAVLIAAPFADELTNPNYHQESDRMHAINWRYLEDIARYVTEGVACYTNAQACPGQLETALRDRDLYFQHRSRDGYARGQNFIPADPPQVKEDKPAKHEDSSDE